MNYKTFIDITNKNYTWKLKKKNGTKVNEDMDNEYEFHHQYTLNEMREIHWKPYFHLLKK